MNQKRIKIFSLATTYPESISSKKPKFIHLLNKELVRLGAKVLVICPHSKGSSTKETMDSVEIRRFRYLSQKNELKERSIPDEIRLSNRMSLTISPSPNVVNRDPGATKSVPAKPRSALMQLHRQTKDLG